PLPMTQRRRARCSGRPCWAMSRSNDGAPPCPRPDRVPTGGVTMSRWPKPVEGSWTEHYPQLDTGPVSYEDSISPEFYELEREAIFKRAWLNVGRVEQLPRTGSYFTKELAVAKTSVVIVKGKGGEVRA